MRVVFDTNVLISSLIKKGKPEQLFNKAVNREIKLLSSNGILAELSAVLKRPRFREYADENSIQSFLALLNRICRLVDVRSNFEITRDKADNMILATAYDGKAEYIVSGDEDLLALKEFKGIRIVSVNEMLSILRKR